MKVNSIVNAVKGQFGHTMQVVKYYSPEIFMAVGATGTVVAAVLACKSTLKVTEVLEETKKDLDDIHVAHATIDEETYSERDYKSDLTKVYVRTGLEMVKLYSGPIVLEVLSIGAMFASNKTLRQRNSTLIAAYGTLSGMYNKYRENVVKTYGEEADFKMRNSIRTEKVDVVEVDEEGNETTVKKKVDICDDPDMLTGSYRARFFMEGCPDWTKSASFNKQYLQLKESVLTDKLHAQGYLFLNEVYRELGFDETAYGQVEGWYDPDRTKHVSLGIFDIHKPANMRFVNGWEPVILIEPNVDPEPIIGKFPGTKRVRI